MTKVKCLKNNRQDKKNGWTVLQSNVGRFSTTCPLQRNFLLLSPCFRLRVFSRDKSWKYFSNSRLPESFINVTNVKKLFLSLAFSDLGVGLASQLMAGIIYAVILKTASKEDYNLTSLCPTVINLKTHSVTLSNSYKFEDCYLLFFLCAASLLTLSTIALDRLLAVSLHLRYQELVTSKRVTIVLISIWLTSCITALIYIFLPKSNEMVAAVILLVGYVLTTVPYFRVYKVVKYHQNQIYGQNQLQNKGDTQTMEVRL